MIVKINKDVDGFVFDIETIVRSVYPRGKYKVLSSKSRTIKRAFDNEHYTSVKITITISDE